MDCIDLFKKAAAALQTDPRYLELDAARRENDSDEELQNLIGEFNLARLDLNNESAKTETNAARVAEPSFDIISIARLWIGGRYAAGTSQAYDKPRRDTAL